MEKAPFGKWHTFVTKVHRHDHHQEPCIRPGWTAKMVCTLGTKRLQHSAHGHLLWECGDLFAATRFEARTAICTLDATAAGVGPTRHGDGELQGHEPKLHLFRLPKDLIRGSPTKRPRPGPIQAHSIPENNLEQIRGVGRLDILPLVAYAHTPHNLQLLEAGKHRFFNTVFYDCVLWPKTFLRLGRTQALPDPPQKTNERGLLREWQLRRRFHIQSCPIGWRSGDHTRVSEGHWYQAWAPHIPTVNPDSTLHE